MNILLLVETVQIDLQKLNHHVDADEQYTVVL